MLHVVFGGLVRVTACELGVTVRDECLMRSVRVVAFLIVLGCCAVMLRGRFMMLGRRKMMFLARENFRHTFSNAVMWWQAAGIRCARASGNSGNAIPLNVRAAALFYDRNIHEYLRLPFFIREWRKNVERFKS